MKKNILLIIFLLPALIFGQRYTVIKYLDTFYYKNIDAPFDSVKITFPSWNKVMNKPTTVSGYGISDAQSALASGTSIKTVNGTSLLGSGDISISSTFAAIISKPTTLSGYGITDAAALSHTHTFASLTSIPNTYAGYGLSTPLLAANNLSDVTAATARTNLGLVIGTNVLAPNGSAASLTSFPTLNQSTTGSAATLTTPRAIQGVNFDGSGAINPINGTGFVKTTGTALTYDNSTYLTTASAASTYEPLITVSNTIKKYWNGYKSFVSLNTDSAAEGATNLFFTNARVNTQLNTYTGDITATNGVFAIGSAKVTNAMLAGSIAESQITNLVTDLGNKQGISSGALGATTGTMTATMTSGTQTVFTITPTGACTFNASGGKAGARATFIITTSGTSAFVLTWSTNFKTTGTLSTGTVSGKVFSVSFATADGTTWVECGRTTAM